MIKKVCFILLFFAEQLYCLRYRIRPRYNNYSNNNETSWFETILWIIGFIIIISTIKFIVVNYKIIIKWLFYKTTILYLYFKKKPSQETKNKGTPVKDYYKILGLKTSATNDEIKDAYRKLAKKFHPDVNNQDKYFEEMFKEVQEAYETLTDSDKRNNYNYQHREFYGGTKNDYDKPKQESSNTETTKVKSSKFISLKSVIFNKWFLSMAVTCVIIFTVIFSISRDMKPFIKLKHQADSLFTEGEYDNAVDVCKEILKLKPDDAYAYDAFQIIADINLYVYGNLDSSFIPKNLN